MKQPIRVSVLDYSALRELPESGMGYYLLTGRIDGTAERALIVSGDYVVPASHSEFTAIEDLWNRGSFPGVEARKVELTGLRPLASGVNFPPGYVPSPGAVPLLGTTKLIAPTAFYRLLMSATDHRFHSGKLAKDTYLTTELDHRFVNSGFAAVGRYALPIPVPACHVISYVFPPGTVLNVGTVQPNFGQSGGGVEVKTTAEVSPAGNYRSKLPEY